MSQTGQNAAGAVSGNSSNINGVGNIVAGAGMAEQQQMSPAAEVAAAGLHVMMQQGISAANANAISAAMLAGRHPHGGAAAATVAPGNITDSNGNVVGNALNTINPGNTNGAAGATDMDTNVNAPTTGAQGLIQFAESNKNGNGKGGVESGRSSTSGSGSHQEQPSEENIAAKSARRVEMLAKYKAALVRREEACRELTMLEKEAERNNIPLLDDYADDPVVMETNNAAHKSGDANGNTDNGDTKSHAVLATNNVDGSSTSAGHAAAPLTVNRDVRKLEQFFVPNNTAIGSSDSHQSSQNSMLQHAQQIQVNHHHLNGLALNQPQAPVSVGLQQLQQFGLVQAAQSQVVTAAPQFYNAAHQTVQHQQAATPQAQYVFAAAPPNGTSAAMAAAGMNAVNVNSVSAPPPGSDHTSTLLAAAQLQAAGVSGAHAHAGPAMFLPATSQIPYNGVAGVAVQPGGADGSAASVGNSNGNEATKTMDYSAAIQAVQAATEAGEKRKRESEIGTVNAAASL